MWWKDDMGRRESARHLFVDGVHGVCGVWFACGYICVLETDVT